MPQSTEVNKEEMQADFQNCHDSLDLLFSHRPVPIPPLCESSAGPLQLKIDPEDLCSPHTAQRVLQQLPGRGLRGGTWGQLQTMFKAGSPKGTGNQGLA